MMINYVVVFVAAIVSMVIGSIWYGPLFGKVFMREMCIDKMTPEQMAEAKKGMWKNYVLQFVASLVMFYVLARFMGMLGALSVNAGLMVAFWVWIGFVVPVQLGQALWGGKMKIFWLSAGNMLVTLLAVGAIFGVWK